MLATWMATILRKKRVKAEMAQVVFYTTAENRQQ
jgi:hypothetical protein